MREFIEIIEGKKKSSSPVIVENWQEVKSEASEIWKKTCRLYGINGSSDYDKEYINQIKSIIKQLKDNHEKSEAYYTSNDEDYQSMPFNLQETIDDAVYRWWNDKGSYIAMEINKAVEHEEDDYFDQKPDIEDSPVIRRFDREKQFGSALTINKIYEASGCKNILTAINYLLDAESVEKESEYGWDGSKEVAGIVIQILNVIIVISVFKTRE